MLCSFRRGCVGLRLTGIHNSSPGAISDVGDEEIVQHSSPVVSPEHVHLLAPGDDGVLAPLGSHKLLATGELLPEVDRLERGAEVERQIAVSQLHLSPQTPSISRLVSSLLEFLPGLLVRRQRGHLAFPPLFDLRFYDDTPLLKLELLNLASSFDHKWSHS